MEHDRLEFAHMLRGPAAMIVVVSHFLGVYWSHQQGVARLIGVKAAKVLPAPVEFIVRHENLIGQIGVGVFFLISGLVISASIEKSGTSRFLARRALRIFPVYAAGFAITTLAIALTCLAFGGKFPYSTDHLLIHLAIAPREWLGYANIDGVSWTLEIEITFYLAMALFGGQMLRRGAPALLAATGLFAMAGLLMAQSPGWDYLARHAASVPMLFAGAGFYLRHKGRMAAGTLAALSAAALVSMALTMAISARYAKIWDAWLIGHLIGLAVFSAFFGLRQSFRHNAIAGHFADISFPLYASHIFVGYAILHASVKLGWPVWLGVGTAFLAAHLIAVTIHFAVEKPAMRAARGLGAETQRALQPG